MHSMDTPVVIFARTVQLLVHSMVFDVLYESIPIPLLGQRMKASGTNCVGAIPSNKPVLRINKSIESAYLFPRARS